jgi:hypothetical protein
MWEYREKAPTLNQEMDPQQTSNVLVSWPRISQPVELWEINFYCV